jgi:hypothetical protein
VGQAGFASGAGPSTPLASESWRWRRVLVVRVPVGVGVSVEGVWSTPSLCADIAAFLYASGLGVPVRFRTRRQGEGMTGEVGRCGYYPCAGRTSLSGTQSRGAAHSGHESGRSPEGALGSRSIDRVATDRLGCGLGAVLAQPALLARCRLVVVDFGSDFKERSAGRRSAGRNDPRLPDPPTALAPPNGQPHLAVDREEQSVLRRACVVAPKDHSSRLDRGPGRRSDRAASPYRKKDGVAR